MEKEKSQEILNSSGVLHATKNDSELFYNSRYDLGKHLGTSLEQNVQEVQINKGQHFTLAKMNVITKNITPVFPKENKPQRSFLFINK